MYKIMIVEDDYALTKALQKTISSWDYEVQCVKRFDAVTEEVQDFEPYLVIMDIMLPFFNGYHWCAEIRKFSKVPVMFLSSTSPRLFFMQFYLKYRRQYDIMNVIIHYNILKCPCRYADHRSAPCISDNYIITLTLL